MDNKENLETDISTQEVEKARFTFILSSILALISFLGVFCLALVLPLSVSSRAEFVSNHTLGLLYEILVFTCLVFWLIAIVLAFVIPLFQIRSNYTELDIVTLNNERIKPTTTKNKVKKFFIDILAIIGFVSFIASQIILYIFIY